MALSTCRFCGLCAPGDGMVQYGIRHYAHFECYLKARKPLSDLHDWQIVQFPYRLLTRYGHLDAANAAEQHQRRAIEDSP